MGPTVNSRAVYDSLTSLLDTINLEPDPLMRLALFAYLADLHQTRVLGERNRAAYEARQRYSTRNIAAVTGHQGSQIYNWAGTHRTRNKLPQLRRRSDQDVSGAIDIAGQFLRHGAGFVDRGDPS
jgi:hypothetical protein